MANASQIQESRGDEADDYQQIQLYFQSVDALALQFND